MQKMNAIAIHSTLFGFVTKHACNRGTDRQMDRITTPKNALLAR